MLVYSYRKTSAVFRNHRQSPPAKIFGLWSSTANLRNQNTTPLTNGQSCHADNYHHRQEKLILLETLYTQGSSFYWCYRKFHGGIDHKHRSQRGAEREKGHRWFSCCLIPQEKKLEVQRRCYIEKVLKESRYELEANSTEIKGILEKRLKVSN